MLLDQRKGRSRTRGRGSAWDRSLASAIRRKEKKVEKKRVIDEEGKKERRGEDEGVCFGDEGKEDEHSTFPRSVRLYNTEKRKKKKRC